MSAVASAALCASIAALALGTSSALAAPPADFGAEGPGAGEFLEAHGVAVEQQSGDIYVVDRNNARIDKFGPQGEFLLAWGWGVAADGSPELETCTTVCQPGIEGAGAGQLELPTGVAVDNDLADSSHGDVYVGDPRNHRVQKFGPSGEFLLMVGGEVNATTHADLCVAGEACQAGTEGSAPGFFEGQGEHALAVGPDGSFYVGDQNRVQRFSPGGAPLAQIGLPGAGFVEQLAVDSAGDLYVKGSEAGFLGVHKYEPTTPTATELGTPRDEAGVPSALAIGVGDELFVDDGAGGGHRILGFGAGGGQVTSFDSSADPTDGTRGIAFGETADGLFVLGSATVRFAALPAPGPYVAPVSETASEITTTTATLGATVNPEGGEETRYHFEYGTEAGVYGHSTAPTALTGGSFEDQPASAAITGLQTRTTYHYRVVATNKAAETTFGPDREFTTLPPVSILAESVSGISATTATLEAELDPNELLSEYHFEYGLTPVYGSSAPIPDASTGAGDSPVLVEAAIEGLQPATTYHYRVVAHNTLGVVEGEDRTFTTQGAVPSLLPDGRAWELVSPPDKHGSAIEAIAEEGDTIQAAASGEAITYGAKGPTDSNPAGSRSLAYAQVISRRGPTGWVSENLTTPNQTVSGLFFGALSEYRLFSEDLTVGAVQPEGATPLSRYTSEKTPYLRLANGEYEPLVVGCPQPPQPCPPQVAAHANVPAGTVFGGTEEQAGHFGEDAVRFRGATPDFSDVLLTSRAALTPDAVETGHENLYEWSSGTLRLVSILPDRTPAAAEGLDSALGHNDHLIRGAISPDGDRVVFESAESRTKPHLFLRDLARGETVRLDLPAAGAPSKGGAVPPPVFQGASADDSRIFFTDEARLTPDAKAVETKPDLYMCQVTVSAGELGCSLRDLSVSLGISEPAAVRGVTAISEDGGRIFFAAAGALTSSARPGDCLPNTSGVVSGSDVRCNLYSYNLAAGQSTLVARLSGQDAPDWEPAAGEDLGALTAGSSPDGRYLAFMSLLPLTGYDNRDLRSGEPDAEVFIFDTTANGGEGELRCASCNPSGARPFGIFDAREFPGLLTDRPQIWAERSLAASLPGWTRPEAKYAAYRSRYLSNSGRLFFNAADALVPQDSNGVEDVYEYEPPQGPGQPTSDTCTTAAATYSPTSGGCVSLISAGTSPEESSFLDASESGEDVFFLTASKLSSQDIDGALDVYDAHACSTASPCTGPPPQSPSPCSGEACQQQGAAPGEPAAQTSTFVGPANPRPRCAKGKVRKTGRCVKKKQGKKRDHGKHNKHKRAGADRRTGR